MSATERDDSPAGLGINGVIPGNGTCVVAGCSRSIPVYCLMCAHHWRGVAADRRTALMAAWRDWQDGDMTLADLREAQWRCLDGET